MEFLKRCISGDFVYRVGPVDHPFPHHLLPPPLSISIFIKLCICLSICLSVSFVLSFFYFIFIFMFLLFCIHIADVVSVSPSLPLPPSHIFLLHVSVYLCPPFYVSFYPLCFSSHLSILFIFFFQFLSLFIVAQYPSPSVLPFFSFISLSL